ncbi:hypothetical protein J6590_046065 [Homalodisca vitripennis]|nr:hypothetical protein J6590_046065 [Homalodisca vitripennis]
MVAVLISVAGSNFDLRGSGCNRVRVGSDTLAPRPRGQTPWRPALGGRHPGVVASAVTGAAFAKTESLIKYFNLPQQTSVVLLYTRSCIVEIHKLADRSDSYLRDRRLKSGTYLRDGSSTKVKTSNGWKRVHVKVQELADRSDSYLRDRRLKSGTYLRDGSSTKVETSNGWKRVRVKVHELADRSDSYLRDRRLKSGTYLRDGSSTKVETSNGWKRVRVEVHELADRSDSYLRDRRLKSGTYLRDGSSTKVEAGNGWKRVQ